MALLPPTNLKLNHEVGNLNTKKMMKQVGVIQRHIDALTVAITAVKGELENEVASKQAIGNAASTQKSKAVKTAKPAKASKDVTPQKKVLKSSAKSAVVPSLKKAKSQRPSSGAKASPFSKARGADKGHAASGGKRI